MRFSIVTCSVALVAMAMAPAAAQGPVRQAIRGAGEAAVEGTGRIVEGAGRAAAGVARGAADVAAGTARAGAAGVRAGVAALTPAIPWQARGGGNVAYDAPWRMQRHNGEWWYYSPQNNWMYHRDGQWNAFAADSYTPAQQYSAGYRGVDQSGQFNQGQYNQGQIAGQDIRVDAYGRQFICQNGQPVYLDEQGQASGQYSAAHSGQFQQGQQGQYGGQMTPTPAEPEQPGADASAQPGAAAQPQNAQGQQGAQGQAEQSTLQQGQSLQQQQPQQPAAQPAQPTTPARPQPQTQGGASQSDGDAALQSVPAADDTGNPGQGGSPSPRETLNEPITN